MDALLDYFQFWQAMLLRTFLIYTFAESKDMSILISTETTSALQRGHPKLDFLYTLTITTDGISLNSSLPY